MRRIASRLPITATRHYNDCYQRVGGVRDRLCIEHGGSRPTRRCQKSCLDRKLPMVTTFLCAAVIFQANEEIARAFGIPEWKIRGAARKPSPDKSRFDPPGARLCKAACQSISARCRQPSVSMTVIVRNWASCGSRQSVPRTKHGCHSRHTARARCSERFGDTLGTLGAAEASGI